jgi:hypothetical protein
MKKLLTKNQVEVIEKLCNELIKAEEENAMKCAKEKNYFGAFMSITRVDSWNTVKSNASLCYRKRYKV